MTEDNNNAPPKREKLTLKGRVKPVGEPAAPAAPDTVEFVAETPAAPKTVTGLKAATTYSGDRFIGKPPQQHERRDRKFYSSRPRTDAPGDRFAEARDALRALDEKTTPSQTSTSSTAPAPAARTSFTASSSEVDPVEPGDDFGNRADYRSGRSRSFQRPRREPYPDPRISTPVKSSDLDLPKDEGIVEIDETKVDIFNLPWDDDGTDTTTGNDADQVYGNFPEEEQYPEPGRSSRRRAPEVFGNVAAPVTHATPTLDEDLLNSDLPSPTFTTGQTGQDAGKEPGGQPALNAEGYEIIPPGDEKLPEEQRIFRYNDHPQATGDFSEVTDFNYMHTSPHRILYQRDESEDPETPAPSA